MRMSVSEKVFRLGPNSCTQHDAWIARPPSTPLCLLHSSNSGCRFSSTFRPILLTKPKSVPLFRTPHRILIIVWWGRSLKVDQDRIGTDVSKHLHWCTNASRGFGPTHARTRHRKWPHSFLHLAMWLISEVNVGWEYLVVLSGHEHVLDIKWDHNWVER